MNSSPDLFGPFVAALPDEWQREACAMVIEDIRGVGGFEEHIKWKNPYFAVNGSAAIKLFCAKGWINIFVYRGHDLSDPARLFEPDDNSSMRTVRLYAGREIDRSALTNVIFDARQLHVKG